MTLAIDDVIVRQEDERVDLDVRVRNAGRSVVNLTEATVVILERMPYASIYVESAGYDLVIDDEKNSVSIAHVLQHNEVDRFTLRLGFPKWNTSCGFAAKLVLRYNGDEEVESKKFAFSSTFTERGPF
jgi:hypothetical protein